MNKEEGDASVLWPAFWCAAPIPLLVLCVGFVVTPRSLYYEIGGDLIPLGVYGFTGLVAAAVAFLAAFLLLVPRQSDAAQFGRRLAMVLGISVGCCAAAVWVGWLVMSHRSLVGAL
jgi:hypothetical protein